ncbi:uncharacterized protein K441DRAFT_676731 [Cenococcum geophilum 1.58]|uniref:uncharacterized protein n=1 Tax=Cenococcum geophilum 1.58 TaxID=794803 RepID=UPI00358FBBCE|nr:hypothetical protein K441DRAFT_676731 [Cenococcum geophilum 1.58]
MLSTRALAVLGAVFGSAAFSAADAGLGERAAFDAYGIVGKEYGEAKAVDEYVAGFAPGALFGEKTDNETSPMIKDRSLELVGRQSCNAGYWYCEAFGRCCPTSTLCCSYGYCIDPERTCCPDASCDPGWDCCGSKCSPKGGDCCSNDRYCEPGNICVRIVSSGRIVCCTDVECTAAVVSGTTSYASVQQTAAPSITAPPSSVHVAATTVLGADIWYWTVTWWYLSFWWITFDATSEVTYTKIYTTTTFTTTATDEEQASSEFAALSETLSFPVPASAHTSLAYYLTASPSAAATTGFPSNTGFTFNPGAFSSEESSSTSVAVVTRTASAGTTTSNTATAAAASTTGSSVGAETRVRWAALVGALVVAPGVLMVWL